GRKRFDLLPGGYAGGCAEHESRRGKKKE
ncbi:hypothetical protein AVDCRST_MAG84-5924, partial [uncultured Microcoleus sp.]